MCFFGGPIRREKTTKKIQSTRELVKYFVLLFSKGSSLKVLSDELPEELLEEQTEELHNDDSINT